MGRGGEVDTGPLVAVLVGTPGTVVGVRVGVGTEVPVACEVTEGNGVAVGMMVVGGETIGAIVSVLVGTPGSVPTGDAVGMLVGCSVPSIGGGVPPGGTVTVGDEKG